jgi:hypothetical protein
MTYHETTSIEYSPPSAQLEQKYINNTQVGDPRPEMVIDKSKFSSWPILIEQVHTPDGRLDRFGFTTDAGHYYDAVIGIPYTQQTDIPILQTTAWLTSSRGHNEHTLRTFLQSGVPTILVGPEGSYRPGGHTLRSDRISLMSSAAAVLRFSQSTDDLGYRYNIHNTTRSLIGESRGAMVGMGILALDRYFNQNIEFADLTAPCFPIPLQKSNVLSLSKHILNEPKSIAKLIGKISFARIVHYPSTIDPHPRAVLSNLRTAQPLFSGEAGDLAKQIPTGKLIHITCFNDDFASMPAEWEKIFNHHPPENIRITPIDGSHITIADPETLNYIHARNLVYHYLKTVGSAYTGDDIFDGAHNLISSLA